MSINTINYTTDRLTSNVREQFLNLTPEMVEEMNDNGRSELVNVCMNLTSDFNKSSVIRAANAFLAHETYLVGGESTFSDTNTENSFVFTASSLKEVVEKLHNEGYFVWAVDNIASYDPKSIYEVDLPKKSAFVYGREGDGLFDDEIKMCDGMVFLPMYGAARSLNIAQAAAMTMGEYTRQNGF